jgi:DNA adenine methylase
MIIQQKELSHNLIAKPFVKWVGGKRSITNQLLQKIPKQINNYYEPFVGGGAMFFELYNKVQHSYLSDLNIDLIITYKTIQQNPQQLIKLLTDYQKNHNQDHYYKIRSLHNISDAIQNSARFIYLMKTCYNGLYRVNKNNEFNTPIGNYKNPLICDSETIILANQALQFATIQYQDFAKIKPQKDDFVYFDPPYHPVKNDSFTNYLSTGFSAHDQIKLRDFALTLTKTKVNIMISNSDAEFIIDLYKNDFNIDKIPVARAINCKADGRKPVYETIITNFN